MLKEPIIIDAPDDDNGYAPLLYKAKHKPKMLSSISPLLAATVNFG